jgi:uncharacterized protein
MVTYSSALPKDLFAPRTFVQLMGIYERNYERLVRLLGDPSRLEPSQSLELPGLPPLAIEVKARSRYTLELILGHRFGDERLPDLLVRLYHDARLVEAVAADAQRFPSRPLARLPGHWQANILLYKWLEYCETNRLSPPACAATA